ncbi:M23 family metallopeptidase [Paenibacillus ihuae]|uniref:M23 family metallopeptidase n=1 Tax=Paenibacillus ihuae TaxID=1232431 RepID=UPI0006D55E55|nr:M23 family metallopeptidase [Paenibacillus ihuae]
MITSSFGYRSDPFEGSSAYHSGIDIAGSIGDPVYAAMDGEVTASEQMGARGKYIIIKHTNGLETWYMHLNGMTVTVGDKVNKGQQIGTLGNTGRSTGPHLHFQVVKQNKAVNPLGYVKP